MTNSDPGSHGMNYQKYSAFSFLFTKNLFKACVIFCDRYNGQRANRGNPKDHKMNKQEKKQINKNLENAGFDGNGRFQTVSHALSHLAAVLDDNGIEIETVITADMIGADGSFRRVLDVARVNRADRFSPESIGAPLVVSLYDLGGTIEPLAYFAA